MSKGKPMAITALVLLALGAGYWAGSGFQISQAMLPGAAQSSHSEDDGHGHEAEGEHAEGEEAEDRAIHLTPEQIVIAKIEVANAGPREVAREIRATGTIVPDADRVAHVVARMPGVVAEVSRRIGEPVKAGDVLAVLESREMADAKSEYLTALRQLQLARTTLSREADLWRKKVSAEQDYLDAKATAETTGITLEAARQRLATLGLTNVEIDALPQQKAHALAKLEVRAPIGGRVIERAITRGELVTAEKEVFTIADLSQLWIDIPVYAAEVGLVREGQQVRLQGPTGEEGNGEVAFVSPSIDPGTGAARVIAAINNQAGTWRLGGFAAVSINTREKPANLAVPAEALQSIGGENVVFVRTDEGFEKRPVEVGRRNGGNAEIVSGLSAGEPVAVSNTFVLKAEASRGDAEHSHAH